MTTPSDIVTLIPAKNALGADTVRASDDELHRAARKGLHEGNYVVFNILPATISRIIEHKVWKSRLRKFASFGEYALDQTSDGLGIENNQFLWLLRCALDVEGAHVGEWASVLEEVERAVKVRAVQDGTKIRDFNGNSLETLGRACVDQHTAKITYLPSRNRNLDGRLIRLQKTAPETYAKVVAGDLALADVPNAGKKARPRKPRITRRSRHSGSDDWEAHEAGAKQEATEKAEDLAAKLGPAFARLVLDALGDADSWRVLEALRDVVDREPSPPLVVVAAPPLAAGDRVVHAQFGVGVVKAVDGLTIVFDTAGQKFIAAGFVKHLIGGAR